MDLIKYTSCGYHCSRNCILRVSIRDGVIMACEPADTINPGIPREDGRPPDNPLDQRTVQTFFGQRKGPRPAMGWSRMVARPMTLCGARGTTKLERPGTGGRYIRYEEI